MTPDEPPIVRRKRWGWLEWTVSIVALVLLGLYLMPCGCIIPVKANQMKAQSNARLILSAMHQYANDHGHYPDHELGTDATAEDAFRPLLIMGYIDDETIFGCPGSRFNPDKNIGIAPGYEQALIPGENHWMLTADQGPSSDPQMPMVFENAAFSDWPPRWHADQDIKPVAGRTWPEGKILVGLNDGSVDLIPLKTKDGWRHLPADTLTTLENGAKEAGSPRLLNPQRIPKAHSTGDTLAPGLPPVIPPPH